VARLHSRIYLHFLGVLLVVAVTTAVVFGLGVRDAFRRQVALGMAHHVAALLGERVDDPEGLEARVRQLHDDLRLSVRVRGLDGDVLAAAGDPLPRLPPAREAEVRAGGEVLWTRPMGFAAAIRHPGSGAVVAVVEAAPPRPLGMPPIWRPVLWAALALAVVAVATRPLAQRISRPVERLTAAVRRLGSGDLSARVAAEARHARRADEIVELTRAFNEMAERVERLVRSEKELLANISHELRSPLARIRLALELIPRDAAGAHHLGDVERDLTELDRLIDDVLTATRLGTTGLPANLAVVDANTVLDDVAERARHDPLTAGLALRVERGAGVQVTADGALLRRALWNLVENAARYGAPPITLSAARVGDRIVLAVSDEGPGIAPGEREQIFAPFYRGEAGARAPHGAGLGLTLARRIAEAHGGTATVEANEETKRGCRVVLSLPRS
jgi:two-component system, OmpR family, sensor kinase